MHVAYSGEHVNRNKHLLQFGPSFPHVRQDLLYVILYFTEYLNDAKINTH